MIKNVVFVAFSAMCLHLSADAALQAAPFQYVGSISINPSQDAKVLADWYSKFGFETKGSSADGYYAMWNTAEGPLFFGIHPKREGAAKKSSGSVSVVFWVKNYDEYVQTLKERGLAAECAEADDSGRFAHYKDPDGNEMTIWGKSEPGIKTDPCPQ